MSVATQIQRIKNAVANAYTAISGKGGTLPVTQNVAGLHGAIESIPTGSAYSGKFDFKKPYEWPEIRDLLNDNQSDYGIPSTYVNKIAMLITKISTPFEINIGKAYRTSDGAVYNQTSISHQFENTRSWVICYSDENFGALNDNVFDKVCWIEGNSSARSNMVDIINASSLIAFNLSCYVDLFQPRSPLTFFRGGPNDQITWSNRSRKWNGNNLTIMPTSDNTLSEYSSQSTVSGLLYSNNLFYVPNLIDLRSATSISNFLEINNNLIEYPRRLFANVSFDISYNARSVYVRESFCKFVDGECPDTSSSPSDEYGLCNNINANPSGSTPTMTISECTRKLFTVDEQSKIETMLRGKGWGIAW